MGANLRTFLATGARLEEVAGALDAWLAAKGFKPIERPLPVWTRFLGGRGFALAENERGVSIAYADAWGEGERVLFELKKLTPTILECWLHDSDIWGYSLHRDGETVAAFCSNPHYFGSMHDIENLGLPLPRNGDARLLTATLGIPEREQALRDLQVKKRVFAEVLTQEFADLVGAPALAIDYLDWQELGVHDLQRDIATVAGHRVRGYVYVPRRSPDERAWDLHRLPARRRRIEENGGEFDGPVILPEGILWTIAILRVVGPALGLAIRVAMFPIALVARYRPGWILGALGRGYKGIGGSDLFQELVKRAVERSPRELSRDGDATVNSIHGLSVVPAEGVTIGPHPPHHDVFQFQVHGETCLLSARDFATAETMLSDLPGEIREDLRVFVDGLPLRMIVCFDERPIPPLPKTTCGTRLSPERRSWLDRFRRTEPAEDAAESPEPSPPPLMFLGVVQEERFAYLLVARLTASPEASTAALMTTLRSLRRTARPSDAAEG